ncbi:MAG: hypothetical protein K6F23_14945 [Solobacterium sp.]|nr:hypothetical protein [Solobacterium sp.]
MPDQEKKNDLLVWLAAVSKAEDEGKHEFICPFCGGKAEVYREEYNNHIRAWCNQCGVRMMS